MIRGSLYPVLQLGVTPMSKKLLTELTNLMRDQFAVESTNPCVLISTGVLGAMVNPVEFEPLIAAAISATESTGDADLAEMLDAALQSGTTTETQTDAPLLAVS